MQKKVFTTNFGNKTLTAEFNDLTTHADGSVMISVGETVVLVTAVSGKDNPGLSYFPLSVEFEEKFYAAGEILGSRFVRREGRPSDEAVLSARIVDRTIRPLFSPHLRREIQVVVTVLAIGEDDPDVLAVIGASLALATSPIPWNGPVGATRLGLRADGEVVVNPTYPERQDQNLVAEILACGQNNEINMIETSANEIAEEKIVALLEKAVEQNDRLQKFQEEIVQALGKPKLPLTNEALPAPATALYQQTFADKLKAALRANLPGKDHIYAVKEDFLKTLKEASPEVDSQSAASFFERQIDESLHELVVKEGRRPDGRQPDELRELYAQAGGISPVIHGTGIFYRGGTRVFSALTLGGPEAAQLVDTMEERSTKKRFMHHYNFPPFSVGEVGRVGGFNRRMIGHGALAEKALSPVVPAQADFPYTIRLVSETLSSNGSSSMASVCASCLAMMDGGVPIKRPVAGIASGVMFYQGDYVLLTDIQGPEDEFGDMDFKVAGTTEGVTAIQMDVKVSGVQVAVLEQALYKAKTARLQILEVMTAAIPYPRSHISPRAPEIVSVKILPDQIGLVIGSGGKTINGIKETSGVDEITIEEDGTVFITGKNGTAKQAAETIRTLTKRYEVGEAVVVTITKLATFGAFAKIDTHNEGLIHISEMAPERIDKIEGLLSVGETVPAIVSKIEDGKIGLSLKRADPNFLAKRLAEQAQMNKATTTPKTSQS